MRFNPDIHHRQSIRLRGYDYSQPGAYFITVCTHQRQPLFGDIVDGKMVLNTAGVMVDAVWHELPEYYPSVVLGEFIVMPNHVHGMIHITAPDPVGAQFIAPNNPDMTESVGAQFIAPNNPDMTESVGARFIAPRNNNIAPKKHRTKTRAR